MNKDGEKEGRHSNGQRKGSRLTKVNNPRVNEKGGKADDVANKFPNFSVLTDEERLVFFEALTAARKNVESRGVPTRDRFGTVHDQYLEYFNREKKNEITDELPESNVCIVDDGSIRRDSSVLDSGEPTGVPSETPSSPNLLPEGDSKPTNHLPEVLEPLLRKQCESVIEEDTSKMVNLYLNKKKENEQHRGRKAPKHAWAFPVTEKPLRETPRFDALNAEEKEIFFRVLQEARNNVVVRNKERKDEILPLDAIVRRYRQENVYASLQKPQKPAEEKNLRVKVTLTSGDNERIAKTKQQWPTDWERSGRDVDVQKRTKPKTPPVEEECDEVKEELSCECVEEEPASEKPEKVTGVQLHRTETKDSFTLKKERSKVKVKLSCECVEEKPREATPEEVTDGQLHRTEKKDSFTLKKERGKVKEKLSCECVEENPREAKPEEVTDGQLHRTEKKDSFTLKKERGKVKEKLSRECVEEKPREATPEEVTDGQLHRTETKDSFTLKKERSKVKVKLSCECVEEKPREATPEEVTDGQTLRTEPFTLKNSPPDVRKLPKNADGKPETTDKETTTPKDATKPKTEGQKQEETRTETCGGQNTKQTSTESLERRVKEQLEMRDVASRLLARQSCEVVSEGPETPMTEEKKERDKGTVTTQVSLVETATDNVEEVEYPSESREALTEDIQGSSIEGEVEAEEAQNCETGREAEDEEIAVHGAAAGEDLVGSSWGDEGSRSLQTKVMIVDDNVIDRIRNLIYYLEAKTKKDDRLEQEYIRLLVDYVAYLSRVMEALVRRKECRQQVHPTYPAGQVHLKFDDDKDTQQERMPESRALPGVSVSTQDLSESVQGTANEASSGYRDAASEMTLISDTDRSIDEGEIEYIPPPRHRRKLVTTKVRLLQDLIRRRAEFVEGSTGEFKIVQHPDPDFVPVERPPTVKLIKEEDEDNSHDSGILRMLQKCFTCGKKREEDEAIYQNLKGEAVRVDVDEGKQKGAENATLNQETMEVLKAAGRKRIIEKYYGDN